MNTAKHIVIALAIALLASCQESAEENPAEENPAEENPAEENPTLSVPGYVQLHAKVLSKGCAVSACHGDNAIGGLSLTSLEDSYAALIDVPPNNGSAATAGFKRVSPGDLEHSFLWWKLQASADEISTHSFGAGMPLGSFDGPGPNSMDAIRRWIESGAPLEGDDFEADWASDSGENEYVSCEATEESEMLKCFGEAPDPTLSLRFNTPPLHLEPGTESIFCSRLDVDVDADILFQRASGLQMEGGHHAAVYVSMAPEDGFEPVDCDAIDMGAMRFVTGAGGAGGQDLTLPEGVGLRIRAGEQLIIQSHYINTSAEKKVVMDVVDLELTPPGSDPIIADAFSVVDSDFTVPVGASQFERVKECVVDRDLDIHLLLGHTHDHGVLFQFELLSDDGEPQLLYHAVDGPTLRDTPEINYYNPPLQLKPGDRVRMTCQWDNLTSHELTWPEEMCVAFMYYSPGEGFLICDSDDISPVLLGGGDSSAGCAKPEDIGNAKGVGKYCTESGDECSGQDANFCIAGFSDENYCTIIFCDNDEACGEGAACVAEGPGSACVPNHCD